MKTKNLFGLDKEIDELVLEQTNKLPFNSPNSEKEKSSLVKNFKQAEGPTGYEMSFGPLGQDSFINDIILKKPDKPQNEESNSSLSINKNTEFRYFKQKQLMLNNMNLKVWIFFQNQN